MANTIGKSSLTAIWKPLCEGSQWEANHSHPKTAANPNDPAAPGYVSNVYQKQYDHLKDLCEREKTHSLTHSFKFIII